MLTRLLRRDWILNRRGLVPVVAIFAAFQVFLIQLPFDLLRLWLVLTCIFASGMIVVPFARDEKFRTAASSCTLPISRADLVRARYVGAWALVAGTLLVAFALAALVPGSSISPAAAFDPGALLLAGTIVTVILVTLLPFVIRFGLRGMAILLIPFNLLLPIVFVVSKATGRQDDVEGRVLAGLGALAEWTVVLRESLSTPVFYPAVLLSLVLLNWASYRLALALFRRREL